MKKYIFWFCMLLILSTVLIGCGGNSGNDSNEISATSPTEMSPAEQSSSKSAGSATNAMFDAASQSLSSLSFGATPKTRTMILTNTPTIQLIIENEEINLDGDAFNDIVLNGSLLKVGLTTFSGDLLALYIRDYDFTSDNTTYTIDNGSEFSNDIELTILTETTATAEISSTFSDFFVNSNNVEVKLNGDIDLDGTVNTSTGDFNGDIEVDLNALVTNVNIDYSFVIFGDGTVTNNQIDVALYFTIDGTTYGPFSQNDF